MSWALLDLLQLPACVLDEAGAVVRANAAWREHTAGTEIRHLESWTRFIWPEDRSAATSCFQRATLTAEPTAVDCRLRDGGPAPRWFRITLQPVTGIVTAAGGWLCIATDIHELKCREAGLERHAPVQADMLDLSVDCFKLIALDGSLLYMNKAGCRALGVPENSPLGMPWLALLPEDVREISRQALDCARKGRPAHFVGRSAVPGQPVHHWDNILATVKGADGQPTAIVCVSREITAEHDALESLRQSQERLALAAHVGGLGVWDYDIEHDELCCDDGWYRIMGRDPGRPIRSIGEFRPFIHPDDVERATEVDRAAAEVAAAGRDYAIVFRIVRPDGEIRWVRSAARVIHGKAGIPARAVGFVVDITDARRGELALRDANRALEEERISLARQNLEDPLTGIANRRFLDSELARICAWAGEVNEAICVGMIDVDHFKLYNDRYGHLEGDAALRRIASALQGVARETGFVGRYGGEEFVLILAGLKDPVPVLTRLAAAVAELAIAHADSPGGHLTISCGCVIVNSCAGVSPAALLKAGDDALYEAKAQGRNRYVIRMM